MSDEQGFFSNLTSYATEYIQTKRRRLQAKPQTQIEGGGTDTSVTFSGQDISLKELKDVREMRESGGIISQVFHQKALIKFGTGVSVNAKNDELEAWVDENLQSLDDLVLDLGEDAMWYPFGLGEVVETQTGQFSHIELVEPYTMLPVTDEFGDILRWEQHLDGSFGDVPTFEADEIGSIVINKASGRDKTGISEALRSEEEINTFRANQQAMRKATERIGYPFVHAKAGREGATQLNDNELRRIRNRLADIGPGETQVTGPDVDIDLKDPATVDFGAIQERDMRMLATALGVPVELLNHGSDGLGSGMPAELRRDLLALQNEADRRRFSDQFVEQFLRPIIREYAPFDHTQDVTLEFEPFLDDKDDMASLISQVGDYMTANEARDKLGLSPLADDEKGESFRTPADIESPDDQPDGGLFGSAAEQAVDREIDRRDLAEIPDKYVEGTGLSEDDFVPNESILDVIEPTLAFIDEHGLPNPDDQQEGAARINQLKDYIDNDEPLAPEFWREISNFHARHRAQGNHVCDEGSLPAEADEIDNAEFDKCHFDNGWFSDRTWGGDPAKEQADRIVAAIEETEGVELSGGMDFRDRLETSEWEGWERQMFELQHGIAHGASEKRLTEMTESQMPQFVKERLRDSIFSNALFSKFESLEENDLMQLRNFMDEQLSKDGWTTDGIADRLQDLEAELTDAEAERIARTETQALVNDAREEGYRETGMIDNEEFYWVGAIDDRTTDACKWLIGGSDLADDIGGAFSGTNPNYGGEPRSLDELKELVKKAAEKDPDVNTKPREYTPHISCRKTYVRDV